MTTCYVPGCSNPIHSQGLCDKHYGRAWRSGLFHQCYAVTAPLEMLIILLADARKCMRRAGAELPREREHWHKCISSLEAQINTLRELTDPDPIGKFVLDVKHVIKLRKTMTSISSKIGIDNTVTTGERQ